MNGAPALQPPAAAASTTSVPPASAKPEQSESAATGKPASTTQTVDAIPELSALPTPKSPNATVAATDENDEGKAANPADDMAVNPPLATTNAVPEQSEGVTAAPSASASGQLPVLAPPVGVGSVGGSGAIGSTTLPPPASIPGASTAPALPIGSTANTSTIPQIDVGPDDASDKKAPPAKTWMTRLAPTATPMVTNFNYRRQILPDAIYKRSYDRENRHLPTVVTMQDYANLFLQAVASNDMNGARALLDRGVSPHTATRDGETALQMARRLGASDTARLLAARGAM